MLGQVCPSVTDETSGDLPLTGPASIESPVAALVTIDHAVEYYVTNSQFGRAALTCQIVPRCEMQQTLECYGDAEALVTSKVSG